MKGLIALSAGFVITLAYTPPTHAGHRYGLIANVAPGPLTIGADITEHIMIGGVEHVSATIYVTGFANGSAIQGFIGTQATPWSVQTQAPGFWNAPSLAPFWNGEQGFAASPALSGLGVANAEWDSGLLPDAPFGPPNPFGTPSSAGGFGMFSDGSDETATPWAWISINSAGVPVGAGDRVNVLRVTWERGATFHEASGSFVIAMNTPPFDQAVFQWWITPIPAPGALALLALAGAAGRRRRRRCREQNR